MSWKFLLIEILIDESRIKHISPYHYLDLAWGIISIANEDELKRIVRALADKHKRLPETGYKEWSKDYTNDKTICENIGKKLGPTIPYNR